MSDPVTTPLLLEIRNRFLKLLSVGDTEHRKAAEALYIATAVMWGIIKVAPGDLREVDKHVDGLRVLAESNRPFWNEVMKQLAKEGKLNGRKKPT